ncbi:MAG: 23S rRNA (adenine(2030)-N(6))-methyltransferase RlmJ [Oleiphilaceae bacterium]|nr:23S rRNA (adenine(2030)-N(6))-methyltransferase RlmJ [Oleiphilaceae bacterium]
MLSYLHAFHAGNFADVQKHATLYLALTRMQAKASPIACFDTHAGSAVYDLKGERALKTGESDRGIQRLWQNRAGLQSDDWQGFMAELETWNGVIPELRHYPGSPAWMATLSRDQDLVAAFELHSTEGLRLEAWAEGRKLKVRRENGLAGLLHSLPPSAPRLLALMDPSYEIRKDYQEVAETLVKAWRKCRHGVFLIWYPILPDRLHRKLLEALVNSPVTKVLQSELSLVTPPDRGMRGSGMLVVNPPWGLGDRLEAMMAEVGGPEGLNASHRLDWLVPE